MQTCSSWIDMTVSTMNYDTDTQPHSRYVWVNYYIILL